MSLWVAWLIAIGSGCGCLFLWFRDVQRIMMERKNTVESAAGQLDFWRSKMKQVGENPDTVAVLCRCEDIYRQAVDLYNRTMQKPFNYLPATLMGFKLLS